jgi:pilus assembly protein Flp/PilA
MRGIHFSPKGQSLVEYALILALVGLIVIVVLALLGPAIGNVFSSFVAALSPGSGSTDIDPPPECYGSMLLPIMVATTGLVVLISFWLPKWIKPGEKIEVIN